MNKTDSPMSTNHPTTLLYLHSSDEMYGADVILLQLIRGLDLTLFRPIVVLPTDMPFDGKLSQALRANGTEVHHINLAVLRRRYFSPLRFLLYGWRFLSSLIWLILFIRRQQVGIIHSNTLAVIPGAIAAWLTRTTHVWHIHEIIVKPKLLWRLTSWLTAHFADQVVAVSGSTRQHICAGHRGNVVKSIVIHNGIDTQRFDAAVGTKALVRRAWHVLPDELLIGMIGRFSHWKGQDYLLSVARNVVIRHPDTKFAFVGGTIPGQTQRLDQFSQQVRLHKLEQNIIISDYRADIPAVLDAYDIFVLPSILPDPLPTVVLEAMAMAKPIVANAHGGSTEMVADQVTGFLVDPTKPAEMEQAIDALICSSDLRHRMGQAARLRLDKEFSLVSFLKRWNQLYSDLSRHQ